MSMENENQSNPFGDTYELIMTHSVAMAAPIVVQAAIFYSKWWWALGSLAGFLLFAITARFRFLIRNTDWFLGSLLWNVVVQSLLLIIALWFDQLWIAMLSCGWAILCIFGDTGELSVVAKTWHIPDGRMRSKDH